MRVAVLILVSFIFITCSSKQEQSTKEKVIDSNIDKLVSHDVPMEEPQPNDWLAVHEEHGQSFAQYIKSDPVTTSKTQNKIYLLPLGDFSSEQENIIIYTAEYLMYFFQLETVVLPAADDSMVLESSRRNIDTENEQLLTTPILNYLEQNIPKDGIGLMAITAKDLYPDPEWNFVFGQARTKNRVGVSSIFRYSDVPLDTTNYNVCLERLIKTSSHEITHMFSCKHCIHAVCVMNGSNNLGESDSRPNRLCSECLRKMQWNLEFNVKKRLTKLERFFAKHRLERDQLMMAEDLKVLN
jgi:archaemetzincin